MAGSALAVTGLAGLASAPAWAQQPVYPLVARIAATARGAGLAGANTAVVGDAGAVFVNPSGVALIRRAGAEATTSWLPGSGRHSSIAGAVRLGQFNLVGGYQEATTPTGSPLEHNSMWLADAVYRFGLFAVSAGVKGVSGRDSTGTTVRSTEVDLSAILAMFDIAAVAVSVQNLGATPPDSGLALNLPTTTRLGFMFNLLDPQGTVRLMGTLDVIWTDGVGRQTVLGGEAGLVFGGFGAVARAGYGPQDRLSTQARWAFGGTAVLKVAQLDYAYQETADGLDGVHRIGVRVTW